VAHQHAEQSERYRPRGRLAAFGALAGLAAAAVLGGCSAATALNSLQPGHGLTETRAVAYGDDPRQVLDVYAPERVRADAPVVVFFYGGGWNSGERGLYAFVGRSLAEEGFVVVVPDYRVYPDVKWPEFLKDSALAVRWARDNAARLGGDPKRLFVMGHSAGAYNAVEIATDKRWLAGVGMRKTDLRGAIGVAGPYDFLPVRTDELKAIFGPEAQRPDTQPINHVDGTEPPMLLMTGAGDRTVDPGNTPRMAARLAAAGSKVDAQIFPRISHALAIGAISPPLRFTAPIFKHTVAFIRQHEGAA
jgi:acetyl esterase/lipase